jgi:hypothetical protein
MKTSCLVFLVFLFSNLNSQPKYPKNSCFEVVRKVKKDWRVDSLGENGYRKSVYKKFLKCKCEYLYPDVLLSAIGDANKRVLTDTSTEYVFYIDSKNTRPGISKHKFISFIVTSPKNYVVKIYKGTLFITNRLHPKIPKRWFKFQSLRGGPVPAFHSLTADST